MELTGPVRLNILDTSIPGLLMQQPNSTKSADEKNPKKPVIHCKMQKEAKYIKILACTLRESNPGPAHGKRWFYH